MEKRLRNQLWRIPLLVTAVFAVIYLIVFLCLGYMPSTERVILFNKEAYIFGDFLANYPPQLGISRWWDLVIIFISAFISVKVIHFFQESFSPSDVIGELHKPENEENTISKDDINSWEGFKIFLTGITSLLTLAGFLMMLVGEESAPEIFSKLFTILFFLLAVSYLIFLIIMPIIIRSLKSKPAVTLFNWAMDR